MFILFEDICLYSLLVHLTGVAIVPNHWFPENFFFFFFSLHRPSPPSVTYMMEVANYLGQNDQ